MGITIYDVCKKWAAGIESGETSGHKQYKSCNVYYNGNTIYSYGSHFPMAYILGPNLVWFNGDTFSVSTNRHQSELRSAIGRAAPDATVVIVPNSALEGASVRYQSIVPVDVHAERWEYTLHTDSAAPAGMDTAQTETREVYDYTNGTDGPMSRVIRELPISAGYGDYGSRWDMNTSKPYNDVVGTVSGQNGPELVRRGIDGLFRWHTARHWLGDAVFTAERHASRWQDDKPQRVHFISSFDRQERRPLYFLSQLPGPVDTVDAAIESLAPDSVKTAREMGRNVVRQGDMFAIEMAVTTRQLRKAGAVFDRRKVTVELRRDAQQQIAQRKALEAIRPTMPDYPKRLYFGQEGYQSYTKATDAWAEDLVARVAAQYPDLAPVPRYGWQSALTYQPRSWDKARNVEATALYGTAHTATEVATLPDGRQFARGLLYHEPSVIGDTWRAADHRRQPLGKAWHLIARNTVPVSGSGTGRRAA